jgi:predicted DNA binding CopG/RHH family protein
MKAEYDFSNGVKNPFYAKLHKDVTVSVDLYLIERLEKIAAEKGVSVQRVINHILDEYTLPKKSLRFSYVRRKVKK